MSYGLQATGGSWWDTNSSYDTPVYPETVVSDIATQGQDVQTSGGDSWTDFFKSTVSQVFDYAIKKDAVITGAEVQKTLQAPVYQPYPVQYAQGAPAAQIVPGISNTLLLLGAGLGVYLMTQK